jgi:hypothetical protein
MKVVVSNENICITIYVNFYPYTLASVFTQNA